MKKFFRALVALLAAVTMAATVSPAFATSAASSSVTDSLNVDAKAAIAIDAKSGKVLYSKNANQVLPIASMTKLITVYLLLQAIHNGKVKWTDRVTPDKEIYKISQNNKLTNVPLRQDKSYTVRQLYQATLIYSANAAAMMLGDVVAGNENKFIDMMNAQVKKWGINDATIVNANGLSNSELGSYIYPGSGKNSENVMTAADMAKVAQNLLKKYPEVLKTTSIAQKTFDPGTSDATQMLNWNFMLKGRTYAQSDLNVDGLKTGTTDTAGDCFTGTATRNGERIITVVLHANGAGGTTKRFVQTARLMRWTFSNWRKMTVVRAGESISGHKTVTVDKGKQETVPVAAGKTITTMVPVGTTKSDVQLRYRSNGTTAAPVKKGATVGGVDVHVKGDDLGYVNGKAYEHVPVKTTTAVAKAGFFRLLFRDIANIF